MRQERATRVARLRSIKDSLLPILSIAGFLIAIPSIYAYLPHLSVAPMGSVSEHQATGTVFEVANNGLFTMNNVRAVCDVVNYRSHDNVTMKDVPVHYDDPSLGDLGAGRSAALPCDNLLGKNSRIFREGLPNPEIAQISIDISYRPSWWMWRRYEAFPFAAFQTDGGSWIWKPLTGIKDNKR